MLITNTVSRSILLAATALFALGGCKAVEKAMDDAKNHVWVCEAQDTPALRASGSLQVQAGGKEFRVKVNDKAKLELGPLVTREDQPIACGQGEMGGKTFSLLLHRKGKPAMTIRVTGLNRHDLKRKALDYKMTIDGNVLVPGEEKPRKFQISSGSVEYVGNDADKIKLTFNSFSALLKGPGEKFPMSFSGKIEIDLAK
jgi:hypothetical protein